MAVPPDSSVGSGQKKVTLQKTKKMMVTACSLDGA
jgi:hypothetical protein